MDPSRICPWCLREEAIENDRCKYCGKPASKDLPVGILPPGTVLHGRYLTGRELGIGGYGITYRALDLFTHQAVAIKEYRPKDFCERSPDRKTILVRSQEDYQYGLSHFRAEATILQSLRDIPEVVRFYELFDENNTAYYVMEYLYGDTLDAYLKKRGKLHYTDAVKLLFPVVIALYRVHLKHTLHRDISPDNIIVSDNGLVRLFDFGASRTQTSNYSNSFMPVEKMGYSPPEQHTIDREGGNQGPWSDVYSMAATIYRCVVGKIPPNSSARQAGDELEFPRGMGIGLTEAQIEVLRKNLSLRREERCSNMLDFARELAAPLREKDREELYSHFPLLSDKPALSDQPGESKGDNNDGWVLNPSHDVPPSNTFQPFRILPYQAAAFFLDMVLFQGVPFGLGRILGGRYWLWLLGGYALGVLITGYLTAYFLGASPGETLFGLSVYNEKGTRPDGGTALIYCLLRLFWPILPVELLFILIKGRTLSESLSSCRVERSESGPKHSAALQIESGCFQGNSLQLNPGRYVFGRDPEKCNMVYPLSYSVVSRVHFQLIVDEMGQITITDYSSYGTWLNQSKLPKSIPVTLKPGNNSISFGNNLERMIINNS